MKHKHIQLVAIVLLICVSIVLISFGLENIDTTWVPSNSTYVIIPYVVFILVIIVMHVLEVKRRKKYEAKYGVVKKRSILPAAVVILIVFGTLLGAGYYQSLTKLEEIQSYREELRYDGEYIVVDGIPPINIIGDIDPKDRDYIINRCIENQPKVLLENTELINLCSHDEFEKLKVKFNTGEAVAFATAIDYNIYVDSSVYGIERVITHELAHNYDFQNDFLSQSKSFKKKYKEYSTTNEFRRLYTILNVDYAKGDVTEFFAEVSDAYFNKPEQLKELYPDLYFTFNAIYEENDL